MSQCSPVWKTGTIKERKGCEDLQRGLNVVRSGRPEQWEGREKSTIAGVLSQCSPVWKTGTIFRDIAFDDRSEASQCSPVWKTGTIPGNMVATAAGGVVSM